MKRKIVASVISCFLFVTANAQVISLDTVMSRIEKNNPALLSYADKITGANERVKSARIWEPTLIGIQAGENPYSFDFENNEYMTMLFAEQSVPSGKRNTAKQDYYT